MQQTVLFSLTRVAAMAIIGQRFVDYQGNVAAADELTVGVADTNAAIGDAFKVNVLGTAMVTAGAPIAANADIKVGADGKAIPQGGTGTIVARALTAATAADQNIEVLLLPK